jgi:hypothetical protein
MKAQGLPINFIVLAALAILILILAAGFVIGGGTSAAGAISPQTVKNNCQNACLSLQNGASTVATKPAPTWASPITGSTFCSSIQVSGVGAVNCGTPSVGVTCILTYQDGTNCKAGCTGAVPPVLQCT